MFRIMLQKLIHKKWMVVCLLLGNLLLIAVAVSHPMYRSASFQRMLLDEYETYREKQMTWPGTFQVSVSSIKYDEINLGQEVGLFVEDAAEKLEIPVKEEIVHYSLTESSTDSVMKRDDVRTRKISIGNMSSLAEHIEITAGRMYGEERTESGCLEAIVSESALVNLNLVLGEEIDFKFLPGLTEGSTVHVIITGVFAAAEEEDAYWVNSPESFLTECFVSDTAFGEMFLGYRANDFNMKIQFYKLFDYESITPQEVGRILKVTDKIRKDTTYGGYIKSYAYAEVLDTYSQKAKTIEATFLILQIPLFFLLCAFLYMISSQMLRMEQNEISLMKSRGAKQRQIIGLYLMQSLFLSGISLVPGILLGRLMTGALGSATAFLTFSQNRILTVNYTPEVLLYGMFAVLLSVTMTVIPVLLKSRVSIVHAKQEQNSMKKPLWQKLLLDELCLGVALYGYYSYLGRQEALKEAVMTGESLDLVLYICSSLFILGAGFLFLRLQPYLIQLLYLVFKPFIRPVGYASFLESIRSGAKQQFIMLFMMLTVALGMFHATVARTMIANARENEKYLTGTDFIVKEVWKNNAELVRIDKNTKLEYTEPDFLKYTIMEGTAAAAKVLIDEVTFTYHKASVLNGTLMGITPKDFAQVTELSDELLRYDYYDYLNVLTTDPSAVLLSENFMTLLDYRLGDTIQFTNPDKSTTKGTVYGFFSYWPGYAPVSYTMNPDGSVTENPQYQIVANLPYLQAQWGVTPYQVWLRLNEGTKAVYDFAKESGTKFVLYKDLSENLLEIEQDSLFQGTNGILTMSFIVILILCGVGYLIYWIMSIRSRELLFGVLRAMGMSRHEIFRMLMNEQLFCGVFSIAAGGVIGYFASKMYVPMIQYAYATANQVLPMELVQNSTDIGRLFLMIALVLIICLVVLIRIVSKLNISNALKLGED